MYDTLEEVLNSEIQHGPQNDRIYLMHLANEDMPEIMDVVENMTTKYKYSKIFAKIPDLFCQHFLKNGYGIEAKVPGFFNGEEDCMFMGKYYDEERSVQVDDHLNKKVLDVALSHHASNNHQLDMNSLDLPTGFAYRIAEPCDAPFMAELYGRVFDSYPFPIDDPNYIVKTMNEDVIYFAIWNGKELVALSSCEMSRKDECVEMTDFAVLPEYRGNHFADFLLGKMEITMIENNIKTAYTIARSNSYGMNITFSKSAYLFSGVLTKNTQIGGEIEDMNVWYKSLEV